MLTFGGFGLGWSTVRTYKEEKVVLHISTHPQRILVRSLMVDQGFQVHPIFQDESGVPLELDKYFEPWRLSIVVVSDGTNQLYRLDRGEGWAVHFARFTEVPADIEITFGDAQGDLVHYLAPGTLLRSAILTDELRKQPGINLAVGITTPYGERLRIIQPLLPVQTA